MRFKGFIGPTYQLRSANVECQRCVNMYPEIDEAGTEKDGEVMALIGTDGLSFLASAGNGPLRCAYVAQNGMLYVVSGSVVYIIFPTVLPAFQAIPIGDLATATGPVSMADNGVDIFIVDGPNGYSAPVTAYGTFPIYPGGVIQTLDPNWQGSTMVWCADGMFVFNVPGTFEFYTSNNLSVTINPLGLASRETPDNIIGFIWDKRNLWLMGQKSTEMWSNTGQGAGGTTGNPFQIVQGGFIECGLAAPFSIQQIENTWFWLGQDPRGNGVVYGANGYSPQRISNHSVELAIQGYGDISNAVAWTHQENGHNFYLINFQNATTTWCFDTRTGLWHERTYTSALGQQQRHRAQVHAFAYGTHIVGDYQNGNIYKLDPTYYSDDNYLEADGVTLNTSPITRLRASPHISDDMNRVFHHKFQLDFQPGVGLDGDGGTDPDGNTGVGVDPQVVMQFSNDGGHTWSNESSQSLGKIGQTYHRAIWRRLGQSRNRVYRIVITDPVEVVMIGAELDVEGAAS